MVLLGWLALLANGWGSLPPLGQMLSPFSGLWSYTPASSVLQKSHHLNRHLNSAVTFQQDRQGVFHIFAENDEDLYLAQGFLVASQRLFQMNFIARVAEGRLSEWVGPRAVSTDIFFQQMDLARAAAKSADKMMDEPFTAMALEAYSRGVNAYIESLHRGQVPIEYKLLGAKPDAWSPYRVALLQKMMTYLLTGGSRDPQLTRSVQKAAELSGLEKLFPLWEKEAAPSITAEDFHVRGARAPSVPLSLDHMDSPFTAGAAAVPLPHPGNGSNNWAVSGAKSRSGFPLLAGDTHLTYQLPAQWVALHLKSPTQDVIGFSLPGSPGVIIGTNRHLAWTVTNGGADVLDWHHITWADSPESTGLSSGKGRQFYLVGKNRRKAQGERRTLKVRGGLNRSVSVTWTHLGPVVDFKTDQESYSLAAHWIGHEATKEVTSFLKLNRAQSVEECFDTLEKDYTAPQQNFLCADRSNIGLYVAGKVPLRPPGAGRLILAATEEPSWTEFVPSAHIPRALNPERGYLLSANQQIYNESYPYYFQWLYRPSHRARRITELLGTGESFSPEDFIAFQKDAYLVPAQKTLPELLRIIEEQKDQLSSEERAYLSELKEWDYQAHHWLTHPTFFHQWWDEIQALLWSELWPDPDLYLWPRMDTTFEWIQKGEVHLAGKEGNEGWTRSTHPVVLEAFKKAYTSSAQKSWGESNLATFPHLLRLPLWERSRVDSGAEESVHAQSGHHGATLRMVVSLTYPPRIWGHHPGGPSGDPLSPDYEAWMDEWASGDLMEWVYPEEPLPTDQTVLSVGYGGAP